MSSCHNLLENNMRRLKKLIRSLLPLAILAVLIFGLVTIWRHFDKEPTGSLPAAQKTAKAATPPPPPSFNKKLYPIDNPNSIWIVVNKVRPLPKNFVPAQLVAPAVPLRLNSSASEMQVSRVMDLPLRNLFTAAKAAGFSLMLNSGYRSYTFQNQLFNYYVKQSGQAAAEQSSARPGYSEHQTGLAADVGLSNSQCQIQQCFGDTPAGKWLTGNAYSYGFIIRYTHAKQAITGYEYEPWHIRYIGGILAKEMHDVAVETLEEFFGLPPAPDYQ